MRIRRRSKKRTHVPRFADTLPETAGARAGDDFGEELSLAMQCSRQQEQAIGQARAGPGCQIGRQGVKPA